MTDFSFNKENRLLNKKDFLNIQKGSKRYFCYPFVVYYKLNDSEISRIGLSFSKKNGNAVKRNFIKRLVRESYRTSKLKNNYDINFTLIRKFNISIKNSKLIHKSLTEIMSYFS